MTEIWAVTNRKDGKSYVDYEDVSVRKLVKNLIGMEEKKLEQVITKDETINEEELKADVMKKVRELNKMNNKKFVGRRSCVLGDFVSDELKVKFGLV